MNNTVIQHNRLSQVPNYSIWFLMCFEAFVLTLSLTKSVFFQEPIDVQEMESVLRTIFGAAMWILKTQALGLSSICIFKTVEVMKVHYRSLAEAPRMYLLWSWIIALLVTFLTAAWMLTDLLVPILSRQIQSNLWTLLIPIAILLAFAVMTSLIKLNIELFKSLVASRKAK